MATELKKEMVVQQPNIIFNMDMDRIKVTRKVKSAGQALRGWGKLLNNG